MIFFIEILNFFLKSLTLYSIRLIFQRNIYVWYYF